MSDLSVLSRIDEIRTTIAQLAPPQVVNLTGAAGAASGASDFAATLAAAQSTGGAAGRVLVAGDARRADVPRRARAVDRAARPPRR